MRRRVSDSELVTVAYGMPVTVRPGSARPAWQCQASLAAPGQSGIQAASLRLGVRLKEPVTARPGSDCAVTESE